MSGTSCSVRLCFKRFILLLLLLIPFLLDAKEVYYNFEKFTTDDGLSQNTAHEIYQDMTGYIWICTYDGLNKYSGYQFNTYKHDDRNPDSISGDNIKCIMEDNEGGMWIGTYGSGLNYFDRNKNIFKSYRSDDTIPGSISDNTILCILEDHEKNLWIGTKNGGVNFFDRKTGTFTYHKHDPAVKGSLGPGQAWTIYEDVNNQIWVGMIDGGLNKFDRETGTFKAYTHNPEDPTSISSNQVSVIMEDSYGNLWIGTLDGLNKLDRKKERLIRYKHDPSDPDSLSCNYIRALCEDENKNLWIGTWGGLNRFDQSRGTFDYYLYNCDDPTGLNHNSIWSLHYDKTGILWIGTSAGIAKLNTKSPFSLHKADPGNPNSLSSNYIRTIYEDSNGIFWIGTNGGGVTRWDREQNEFKHYKHNTQDSFSISSNMIYGICEDNAGELWVGTVDRGLNRYDPENDNFTRNKEWGETPGNIEKITTLFKDREGEMWIGTNSQGLYSWNHRKQSLKFYKQGGLDSSGLTGGEMGTICDNENCIWIGTDNGLNRLNKKTGKIDRFIHDPSDPSSLSNNHVRSLLYDSSGTLWIGTMGGGLNRLDKTGKKFESFGIAEGLPNNYIYGILQDNEGNIWISTNRGISRICPEKMKTLNFTMRDNLQDNEFNYNAFCKSSTGELFFGGVKGINSFFPGLLPEYNTPSPLVLTAVSQNGEDLETVNKHTGLPEIILGWEKNFFDFEMALLNYEQPENNTYAYKLEGIDAEWNRRGTKRYGRYTNLPGGKYTLKIKGANNHGVWNPGIDTLRVIVKNPPWKTLPAYIIYTILGIGIMIGIYFFIKERERNRALNQLNKEKTMFFVNLSHEIKTPITLISNYLEKYLSTFKNKEDLDVVRYYVEKLKNDLNHILILEKINYERQVFDHNLIINFSKFVEAKVFHFQEPMEKKEINFTREIEQDIYIKADSRALEHLCNNLLDNAIKYTHHGGSVYIGLKPEKSTSFSFCISNTSPGISPGQMERIFDPYYQLNHSKNNQQGIGMGLYIVKKIVESLPGTIEIMQERGITSFHIKASSYSLKDNDKIETFSDFYLPATFPGMSIKQAPHRDECRTLFFVEDNSDMIYFLHSHFKKEYNVYFAKNGREALKKMDEIPRPDIIISDIMMDEMDGFQLYKEIKKREECVTTPFIFLTAINNPDIKIESFTSGVTDFITKPFSIKELEARIKAVLVNMTLQIDFLIGRMEDFLKNPCGSRSETLKPNYSRICEKVGLTERESEVLNKILEGKDTREIAHTLFISANTVNSHIKNLYRKLNINKRSELFKLLNEF